MPLTAWAGATSAGREMGVPSPVHPTGQDRRVAARTSLSSLCSCVETPGAETVPSSLPLRVCVCLSARVWGGRHVRVYTRTLSTRECVIKGSWGMCSNAVRVHSRDGEIASTACSC